MCVCVLEVAVAQYDRIEMLRGALEAEYARTEELIVQHRFIPFNRTLMNGRMFLNRVCVIC